MNGWTESLGDWLLRTSIEGSILIAAVIGLSWVLGRHLGPRWRVALWTIVGLKLLIPAFIPTQAGLGNWLPHQAVPVSESSVPGAFIAEPFESVAVATPAEAIPAVPASFAWSSASLIAFVWVVGAMGFVISMIVRHRRFFSRANRTPCRDRRLLAMTREVAGDLGIDRDIQVMMGPEGSTPAVFGAWRSRLLLPHDWERRFNADSLRHILMHEIEHIRYRDVLWNWMAAAVNAIHWFNPLVWIAVSRFQSDRELRCDAGTVSRLEPTERIAYGQTLLRVQKNFIAAPATSGLAPCVRNHPTLRQRIHMITNPTDKKSWLNAILMLAVAGLIAFSFGSASADDERSSREGDGERSAEREGSRDGESSREGSRDGEGSRSREGSRDGEGSERREGDRDGEGSGSREGARDGEGSRSREGARDGEGSRSREGARDGEAGVRDGELKVTVLRDGVVIGDEKISLVNLRRTLDKSSASSAVIFAQPDVPFQNVTTVANSLKSSGIKDIRLGTTGSDGGRAMQRDGDGGRRVGARDGEGGSRSGPRDGEGSPSREGARDGDRPREGARDGEGSPRREGARDGEGSPSREGARDGEGSPSREGARDGDRPREGEGGGSREGARDGEGGGSREGARDAESGSSSPEMDDRKLAQLTRIYRVYDKDGDNGVTFEEWVAMKNYELTRDQEEREKGWFDQADSNEDGKVTLGEWIDWKISQ